MDKYETWGVYNYTGWDYLFEDFEEELFEDFEEEIFTLENDKLTELARDYDQVYIKEWERIKNMDKEI
jgi:hypothetical protein